MATIDFDSEVARIARELKDADTLKNTPLATDDPRGGSGAFIGQQLSQLAGRLNERDVLSQQRELSAEEGRQSDALMAEYTAPGTKRVLKKTLDVMPDMALDASAEPTYKDVETQVPMTELEEVQRRTGVANQMSRLPRARAMSEKLTGQLALMPEKIAAREDAQAQRTADLALADKRARELAAQRAIDDAKSEERRLADKAEGRSLALTVAQMNSGDRRFATKVGAKQAVIPDANSSTGFRYWNPEIGPGEEAPPPKAGGAGGANKADPAVITRMYDDITRNVDKLIDKDGKANSDLEFIAGPRAQHIPKEALGEGSNAAIASLDALQKQMTMLNLAEAKKAVGQSFGSMQAQEWQKFTDLMAGLNRSIYPEQLAENIKYIREYVKNNREVMSVALGAPGVKMEARPGTAPAAQEEWTRDASGKLVRK